MFTEKTYFIPFITCKENITDYSAYRIEGDSYSNFPDAFNAMRKLTPDDDDFIVGEGVTAWTPLDNGDYDRTTLTGDELSNCADDYGLYDDDEEAEEDDMPDEPSMDDLEMGFNPYMGTYDFDC